MVDNYGVSPDPGYFNRQITELKRELEALRSERRAGATEVADGDFVVSGGGSVLVQGGGSVIVSDGGSFQSQDADSAVAVSDGGLFLSTMSGGVSTTPRLSVHPDKITFDRGPGTLTTMGSTAPGLGFLFGTEWRISHPTSPLAANTVIGTDGLISRSTSSRRYKTDEELVDVDPAAVLALEGKTWRDRGEVETDPDTENRYVGFIAEDLDDLGLTEFVVYDDEGRPDAISYDRLSVALLALAKSEHKARLDVEKRLEKLEQAVDTLTKEH